MDVAGSAQTSDVQQTQIKVVASTTTTATSLWPRPCWPSSDRPVILPEGVFWAASTIDDVGNRVSSTFTRLTNLWIDIVDKTAFGNLISPLIVYVQDSRPLRLLPRMRISP